MVVRSSPVSWFHLSFLLPKGIIPRSSIDAGFAVSDCTLRIVPPLVKIRGPSREAVFAEATCFLQLAERPPGPIAIAATLTCPAPVSGTDRWSIIVGADVAFSPTSLDPHFPNANA